MKHISRISKSPQSFSSSKLHVTWKLNKTNRCSRFYISWFDAKTAKTELKTCKKIRNLRFALKIHYTVFRYNSIAQLIKCGICNYFIWIHIFSLIIFQKEIDTHLNNFNLFIYIYMYLHKMIYVCVCPVGGYFIHQIYIRLS